MFYLSFKIILNWLFNTINYIKYEVKKDIAILNYFHTFHIEMSVFSQGISIITSWQKLAVWTIYILVLANLV